MKYRPGCIRHGKARKPLMRDALAKRRNRSNRSLQLFDRNHTSIQGILARTGGIQPRPDVDRSGRFRWQSGKRFVEGLSQDTPSALIASSVEAGPIHDQPGNQSQRRSVRYRASQAEQAAWDRASRPKPCKLAENRHLASWSRTSFGCSGHRSRLQAGSNLPTPATRITGMSHETIYRTLHFRREVPWKKELLAHLRRIRAMRRSGTTQKTDNHGGLSALLNQRTPGHG